MSATTMSCWATIITDGEENASREYDGHSIYHLVGQLKEKGWVFAYIGTNQDVDAVADGIGIHSRTCYEYSEEGARSMFELENNSMKRFYDRLHQEGRQFIQEESYDYFQPDNEYASKHDEEPEEEPGKNYSM